MIASSPASLDLYGLAQQFFDQFVAELRSHGLIVDPAMELRRGTGLLCYYDLADGHIYLSLPDLDDPAGRLHLFMMSSLMGCENDEETSQFFQIFIPHLIAHELAHHLRHQRGLFSPDPWFEEQVANKLAVAMCRQRLTPELMAFSTRIVPGAIRSITEQLGSATMAIDAYRDLAHSLNVAGSVTNDALAHIDVIRRLFPVATETLLAASGRLAAGDAERVSGRDALIAAINEDYKTGPEFVRYVYYHLGWSFIGLVGRESHYIEEFAHDYLDMRPDFLPPVDDYAVTTPAAIQACYTASRAVAGRSATAAHYFEQRYRALLIAAIHAAFRQAQGAASTSRGGGSASQTAALLDLSRDGSLAGLDYLSAIAPSALKELLPGQIETTTCDLVCGRLPAESDRRLWQALEQGVTDPGATVTLHRMRLLRRSDALRGLPAAALLDLARHSWLHKAAPGTLIARQGDGNDDVYFLLSGTAEAITDDNGQQTRARIDAGQMFGADAFFSRRPRAASVRASEPATCLAVKSADLRVLAFTHPALLMGMAGAHIH